MISCLALVLAAFCGCLTVSSITLDMNWADPGAEREAFGPPQPWSVMDLLQAYGSDEESGSEEQMATEGEAVDLKPELLKKPVSAAPYVNPALKTVAQKPGYIPPNQLQLTTNVKAATLLAPLHGPAHPHRRDMDLQGGTKLVTGAYMEPAAMEQWAFYQQLHTFNANGYAEDYASGTVVGDVKKYQEDAAKKPWMQAGSMSESAVAEPKRPRKRKAQRSEEEEAEAAEAEDLGDEDAGPWAPVKEDRVETELEKGTLTDAQKKFRAEVEARKAGKNKEYNMEEDHDRRDERKIAHLLPPRHDRDTKAIEPTSQFHGKDQKDYQGRPWTTPPAGLRPSDGDHQCYIPKKCVHKYTGHTKGVQAIEFIPTYGNLLLSGSLDGKAKVWDVYNERRVRRTYNGHSNAIRCLAFNNDGSRFLTGGFDRFIRLWDTETGQCINTFTNRKVPYCIKFYPVDNNTFITGMSDNRLYAFDCNSGEITQEYNHHLAAVNTITFYDDNRRFASTSDDKKMLLWEWNIPVPIKYIAEPAMHSMPAVTSHPSGGFIACQSLDNTIRVYSTRDRFKEMRKKIFKGHTIAGYACVPCFSPNGKFLCSGDGEGKLYFWDWKSGKMYNKYKAHDNGPTIGTAWHPIEPSLVASCGWDGIIKLWD